MNMGEFISSIKRILKLIKKPSYKELWFSIKISALGIIAVGIVGYIIMIIATALTGSLTGGG